ncbi:LOW QUALITY PROTEIN: hypothetical protein PHMEG_00015615 [Phytophthora megakarya]|uniref:Uncharacterized protein n=1 Tax=Phytophthora megakarya TaxID=4795 RepID=A0A225W0Y9_9STRA|nr:LOW QUALITY PROTEIN: hypothetical protein PHMEG_00015615 [Phytophthora megakarya]
MQCLPDWKHLPSPPSSVMLRALTTQFANPGCQGHQGSVWGYCCPKPNTAVRRHRIVDDAEAAVKHLEPGTVQRRDYYISLFHELRHWSSKKTSGRSDVPEWQALCQSWNQFVTNFNNTASGSLPLRFAKYSVTSAVQRVHEASVNAKIPCAVLEGVHCPHCPVGAPRVGERDFTGYTSSRVPANIKELRAQLVCTRQHPSVVTEHYTPRNTAPRSSVVGFVRHHHFRNVRHQETTYLEGEPIVSNEYENEPDLGSSSDWCGQQSDPPRGGSYRGQSYAYVGGADLSSHGQPRVDHSHQARVKALEDVQAVQFDALKQELHLRNACMCEAAQTVSNICVQVFEKVRLLQEKVKRLEEKLSRRRRFIMTR